MTPQITSDLKSNSLQTHKHIKDKLALKSSSPPAAPGGLLILRDFKNLGFS